MEILVTCMYVLDIYVQPSLSVMTDPTRYIIFLYLAEYGDEGKSPTSAKIQSCTSVSTGLLHIESEKSQRYWILRLWASLH